jgi:hypothetical protein
MDRGFREARNTHPPVDDLQLSDSEVPSFCQRSPIGMFGWECVAMLGDSRFHTTLQRARRSSRHGPESDLGAPSDVGLSKRSLGGAKGAPRAPGSRPGIACHGPMAWSSAARIRGSECARPNTIPRPGTRLWRAIVIEGRSPSSKASNDERLPGVEPPVARGRLIASRAEGPVASLARARRAPRFASI